MAKLPDTEHLLELLQRAAAELKAARAEAATAIAALKKEQGAHEQTQLALEEAEGKLKGAAQHAQASADAVGKVAELELALASAQADGATLREMLETEKVARQKAADERTSALAEKEHLLAATATLEQTREALVQAHQIELEAERSERAALLADAAGKLVALEAQLSAEREQLDAAKYELAQAREQARLLEEELRAERERLVGLEAAAQQLAEQHGAELEAHQRGYEEATAQLRQYAEHTAQQLSEVTAHWQHVERQYEALHREMLTVLEQRDEARRLLEQRSPQ